MIDDMSLDTLPPEDSAAMRLTSMSAGKGTILGAAAVQTAYDDIGDNLCRKHRADEQQCRTRVASCSAVAQEQRRHRQRGGQPIRRADAECGSHVSLAESQRLGVVDCVLRGVPRRLRRSFLAAPSSGDGGRLTGDFHARPGPSEAEKSPQIVSPEPIFGRIGNS